MVLNLMCYDYYVWFFYVISLRIFENDLDLEGESDTEFYTDEIDEYSLVRWRWWKCCGPWWYYWCLWGTCKIAWIGIFNVEEEIHLGWWVWILCNLSVDFLFHEEVRGLFESYYKNLALREDYDFEASLEISDSLYKKFLTNFSESRCFWICKWWSMNL